MVYRHQTYYFLVGLQVGKHGLIIEFTDQDYNVRRSATYLPEVAAHEGQCLTAKSPTKSSLVTKAGNISLNSLVTKTGTSIEPIETHLKNSMALQRYDFVEKIGSICQRILYL